MSSDAVLDLVAQSSLSSYDCEYVALAQRFDSALPIYDTSIPGEFPNVAGTPNALLDS